MQKSHSPEWDLWPTTHPWVVAPDKAYSAAGPALESMLARMGIAEPLWGHLTAASLGLGSWIASQHQRTPLLIGINGAQGSGKSTTAELLATTLTQVHRLSTLQCSIDDFYLTHNERVQLSRNIHPLLLTRGVPGTHDLGLLNQTLHRLRDATPVERTPIPRFNKAIDDRLPQSDWVAFEGRPDVVILEGWCVGTPPQPERLLQEPINRLEALEDAEGLWRKYVNDALSDSYRSLYDRLDLLLFLKIPDFSAVMKWRALQEEKLKVQNGGAAGSKIMDPAAIERFIMHFERLTRWSLEKLPAVADLTLAIDPNHRFVKRKE